MNLNDEYLNETENLNKYISQLRTEISKKNRNSGVDLENFDIQIKKLIEEAETCVKRIKEIIQEFKLNRNLSELEMERRTKDFEERKRDFNSLKNDYYYSIQGQKNNDQFSQYMNIDNPQEYYIKLKEERNMIDQNVLEMTNTVKQIRKTQTNLIGDVISNQNKLAEATEIKMDKAKVKLDKTKERLSQYLETSSNPCLGFIIFVEIAILILVILTV